MFDRVGGKIQTFAKVIFYIQSVISILVGLAIAVSLSAPFGLLILVVGPLSAWIGSLFLYAFGLLVESTVAIERNTRGNQSPWLNEQSQNFRN